jgi:hypothetical protein
MGGKNLSQLSGVGTSDAAKLERVGLGSKRERAHRVSE